MRIAGATARAMLVQAAAAKWSVDPASCRTENGEVLHDASAQKASYGELVQAAAALTPPQDPPLKPATDFKLIGKSLKRLDTPDKVNGKAVYGIDARPAGVKIATLASCPVFGGKVAHVNDERAKTMPGVRQVIVLDDLVAVVGDHMWAAKKGLGALDITWDEGPNAAIVDGRRAERPCRRKRESGRGREIDRRCRQGSGRGNETRGDLPCSVPGSRADGADELHRARSSRRLRDLGRQSGHHPRARDRREADGPAAGEGDSKNVTRCPDSPSARQRPRQSVACPLPQVELIVRPKTTIFTRSLPAPVRARSPSPRRRAATARRRACAGHAGASAAANRRFRASPARRRKVEVFRAVLGKERERVGVVQEAAFGIAPGHLVPRDQRRHVLGGGRVDPRLHQQPQRDLGSASGVPLLEGRVARRQVLDAPVGLGLEAFDVVEQRRHLHRGAARRLQPQHPCQVSIPWFESARTSGLRTSWACRRSASRLSKAWVRDARFRRSTRRCHRVSICASRSGRAAWRRTGRL